MNYDEDFGIYIYLMYCRNDKYNDSYLVILKQ